MKKYFVSLFLFLLFNIPVHSQTTREILYAGTFSVRGSEGVYVYEFNRKKTSLKLVQTVRTLASPTYLAVHPSGRFVYTVNRDPAPDFTKPGSVSAFVVHQKTGQLAHINNRSSYGAGPCHISIDKTGKLAIVSNYAEGNLTVFSIEEDGSLGPCTDSIRFSGNSVNKERQEQPHIHSATISPDNRFVHVADLGTDKIYTFSIDTEKKKLSPAATPFVTVKPGSGPRHFTFSPDGKMAFLSEELSSTVATFTYDDKTGSLTLLEDRVASLPPDFSAPNISADIHTDITGKYLFMSNRGHESLAIYSINDDGKLELKGIENTRGSKPRNFLVDPKNQFVFVAHQDTDNIVTFKWDAKTGKLRPLAEQVIVPSPVCLKMLELQQ